jgi:hypothetical protein
VLKPNSWGNSMRKFQEEEPDIEDIEDEEDWEEEEE